MMPKQELLSNRVRNISVSAQNELGWDDHLFIHRGWQRLGRFVPPRFSWLLSPRFLKFCAVGLSGIVVNMGMLYILTELCGLFYLVSSPIAIECSFLSNFFLNDVWTWKGVGDSRATERLKRLGKFHIVYAAGLVVNAHPRAPSASQIAIP